MVRRWLAYALALFGAVAFRVFYTGWLPGLILPAVACFPLLGVLLALPGVLSCRLSLSAPERTERESGAQWTLTAKSLLGLPLGRVWVTLTWIDRMTGQTGSARSALFLPGQGTTTTFPAATEHCGLLEARISSAWACDCLGLLRLPLFRGKSAQLWVTPLSQVPDLPPLPEEAKPGLRPRPGGGPGEDYDPRAYRPGDPLSSIHWKLSAKRDDLVVRETLETVHPLPLLTFDCFGSPAVMDRLLDILQGTGKALLDQSRPFSVAWAEPMSGELRRFDVAGETDLRRCIDSVLSQPCPEKGKSILDTQRLGISLHLTGGETP